MKEENKEKATVAIANSILGQITLSDVLQLVQGNVLQQAKTHVEEMGDEELENLISKLETEGGEPQEESQAEAEESLQAVSDEE